jgi:hypothetical protein
LWGVSCSSLTTCDAVGQTIVSTANWGTTWTGVPTPDGIPLQAIACPSGGLCQAVGVDDVVSGGP